MGKVSQSEILRFCLEAQIPFVVYKLPNQKNNVLIVSKEVECTDYNNLFSIEEDIFSVAPFSDSHAKVIFFRCDYEIESDSDEGVFDEIKSIKSSAEYVDSASFIATYADYEAQFKHLFSEIKSGKISKAILSRIKYIPQFGKELALDFYYKLSVEYPKAYTFMMYTPQTGLWTGASPELLFQMQKGNGTTVSLAGTRKNSLGCEDSWNDKEADEQQIVSDFVRGVLFDYGINDVHVVGPETIVAGKISHLKTQYCFPVSQIGNKLGSFINDLHPTPAVCGLPKKESMQIINQVERHNRSYYAGFLGRIQKDDIKLFVNIRSMKFVNNGVDLYLGGGITAGSVAEKEWQETELKAGTMMNVINKVKRE